MQYLRATRTQAPANHANIPSYAPRQEARSSEAVTGSVKAWTRGTRDHAHAMVFVRTSVQYLRTSLVVRGQWRAVAGYSYSMYLRKYGVRKYELRICVLYEYEGAEGYQSTVCPRASGRRHNISLRTPVRSTGDQLLAS